MALALPPPGSKSDFIKSNETQYIDLDAERQKMYRCERFIIHASAAIELNNRAATVRERTPRSGFGPQARLPVVYLFIPGWT